eukprot:scaffold11735_cov56-Phaeocystis_antarctica.AAC.8
MSPTARLSCPRQGSNALGLEASVAHLPRTSRPPARQVQPPGGPHVLVAPVRVPRHRAATRIGIGLWGPAGPTQIGSRGEHVAAA